MRSKKISKVNSTRKRKITNSSRNQTQHLDDILNEDFVTFTIRQQPIRSSASSHSTNKTTASTNIDEISCQNQLTNRTHEETDILPVRSEVWNYATKLENGRAKCHNCNREISCKDHSTSGLRRHLHRCINISKFTSTGSILKKQLIIA